MSHGSAIQSPYDNRRKPGGLLLLGSGFAFGGDCLAAMGASLTACFMEFSFCLSARIALRQ